MEHYTTCSLYHQATCSLLEAQRNLFTQTFSLAFAINIRHLSSNKIISVAFEPQWYIRQHVVFTTRPLARCWKPSATYSLIACATNIVHISSYKRIFVRLEPQWYITQRVFFTIRPLARCWKLAQLIHPNLFLQLVQLQHELHL